MRQIRVAFVSVVPSPYQRDLFRALSSRPEIELNVFYMEKSAPDSPWPDKPLAPYEAYLPGFWFPLGNARVHVNWRLPDMRNYDVCVLNTLMSLTAQSLMRVHLRGHRWLFWGERLGKGGRLHSMLSAPLRRASGIVAIGTRALEDYRERFPGPRHFNIPYHCDLESFESAPRARRTSGRTVFLFCGQMIARKGVDFLLQAFAQLDDRAELLLVGREAELNELLSPLPLHVKERIRYAGFQPPEELPALFAEADVFVLPSRYDGWGVVVNQALGAGLAVLCSDSVGAGFDLVEPEVNGLRFPAENTEALAMCMRRCLDAPDLIERWGRASRERAHLWQPEAGAAKWVKTLEYVMSA